MGRVTRSSSAAVLESRNGAKSTALGQKRYVCPSPPRGAPKAKRTALGDLTNREPAGTVREEGAGKKARVQGSVSLGKVQPCDVRKEKEETTSSVPSACVLEGDVKGGHRPVTRSMSGGKTELHPRPVVSEGITPLQESLQAACLHDTSLSLATVPEEAGPKQEWVDIDAAEANNPLYAAVYAEDICQYMKRREDQFLLGSDILAHQKFISPVMRTILVDWLVELQENFELYHETLYLTVKLADHYLARKVVRKEYLQLVGAAAMLLASKFEELSPPLVDDFVYLCDDAYTPKEVRDMEADVLATLQYDINIPVAYQFLRRYAKVANASFDTLTLARYICESSLQVYKFVPIKASLLAAAAMYLALRMKNLGGWTAALRHYTGCKVEDLLPLAESLNAMLREPWESQNTVRTKYSHMVFCKVATIAPLEDVRADALKVTASS